ncbi:Zinc finger BED domain-containing protein 4 [Frankliniella fusca]|uniref:Zinc finger BED domain-containing protein 4 n=1 Tax=Frankliniella fusca TaxID=407009 RepID=A0AAE1HJ50_9NEOP|nr:Zinc finger BED domain-containing protein 4 [Frankliniella fusca]
MPRSSSRSSSSSDTGNGDRTVIQAPPVNAAPVNVSVTPAPSNKRKKRQPKHPVHDVVVYHEDDNDSWCTVTGCTYKSPGSHAGNKMAHLRSEHPDVYASTQAEWERMCGTSAGPSSSKKPKCSLDKVMMSGPALEMHSLRLVTEHGLSFEVLEYQAFKDIIAPMLDAMPKKERPTISATLTPTKISGLAARVRQKMAAEMDQRLMSMQIDGCSKRHRHFIGVNVQYIKEGETVVRTLAVEELHVRSSAENLKSVLQQILRKFDVPPKNIISVTSDNGANYLLAGKLLHLDDDAVEDVEDLDDAGDADDPEWLDVDLGTEDEAIQSVRCAAHTLQLAVSEGLGKVAEVKPIITAVRELANFLRTPTNVRQLKNAKKPLPQLDVVTRWGSTYNMLKSVASLQHFVQAVMDVSSRDRTQYILTDDQWEKVDDLLGDLFPVYTATIKLQARDLTLGQLLAIWTEAVIALKERRPPLTKAILQAMDSKSKAALYKDRERGEKQSSLFDYPAFNAAVFADPRFFSMLSPDQTEQGKEYLVNLWQKLQSRRGVEVAPEANEPEEDEAPGPGEDNAFATYLAKKNREREAAKSSSRGRSGARNRRARAGGAGGAGVQVEAPSLSGRAKVRAMIEEYDSTKPLPLKSDVLKFWESKRLIWPELYELAMIVLAIPATQVSVERLFSALRFILRPQRFALSSNNVDDIVFLHANADLVREVAQEYLSEKIAEESEEEEEMV